MAAVPPAPLPTAHGSWSRLWLRTAIAGLAILSAIFGGYEVVEQVWLRDAPLPTLHALHIVRGVGASLTLGTWAFLSIRSARRALDAARDGYADLLRDAVEQRTKELSSARAFTELLFNSLRERILVADREGRVVKANRVALEVIGADLVGRRCMDFMTACREAGSCLACVGGPVADAQGVVRADAAGRLWELETLRLPSPEQDLVIEVGRDVTAQRNLEAQVRHQEKMASLGVLAAGFAHDLGNPLASLSTELELLEGETDVARYRESLEVLRRSVGRMTRTLREMVDFARRRRDELSDVSVGAAITDSARLMRHDPRFKRIEFIEALDSELPPVRMVEDHLVMVLINLMINAADAMPNGGTLEVSARAASGEVLVRVRDSGVGMSQDVAARAMTPLFTTKSTGTGLGLSVSRNVVHNVGGDLTLESELGVGTAVTIRLPAVLREEPIHG